MEHGNGACVSPSAGSAYQIGYTNGINGYILNAICILAQEILQSGPSQYASREMAAILLAESYVVWSAGRNYRCGGKEEGEVVGVVALT